MANNILPFFLVVHFRCPNTKQIVRKKLHGDYLDQHISRTFSLCDLCGSHGKTVLTLECPVCGKEHSFELETH